MKISELKHGDIIEWKTPRHRRISSSEFSNSRSGKYIGIIRERQSLIEAFPWTREVSHSQLRLGQRKTESSTNLRIFIEVERETKKGAKLKSNFFAPTISQVLKVNGEELPRGLIIDI